MSMQKRNFHTFDALRFFAFFKVFIFHLPIYTFPVFNFLKDNGGIGVLFFFVLSGFLITYIILEEKELTGSLNLKNFFVRRILRIWPLYYLMIAFVYISPWLIGMLGFDSSSTGYQPQPFWSLTFLENYKMIAMNDHPNVSPLGVMWSLCIEEHFYIVWGLLLFFMHKKYIPALIITSFVISIVSRMIFIAQGWKTIDLFTNLDLFAWGALPAYLLIRYRDRFEKKISSITYASKIIFLLVLLCAVYLLPLFGFYFKEVFAPFILGGIFSCLIMLIIPEQNRFRISRGNVLSKWGVFTYGLYLYHTIVINLFLQVFIQLQWDVNDWKFAILFSVVTFMITIIISKLSYITFERFFLRLKKYFYA